MALVSSVGDLNVAVAGKAVTPSDANSYSTAFGTDYAVARALYVGVTGNIVLLDAQGNTVTFSNVPAGAIIPIAHTRVNATSTTATNMVALF